MTVQRNNIARMPWRLREIVYRMLFEGASGDQVRAEIARLDPAAPVPHNTSIQAIRERDADYAAWRERAMGMAADQQRRRTTWAATDDGSAETGLRAARYLVLSSMVEALADGNGLTPSELARLASGLKALQDDLLAKLRALTPGQTFAVVDAVERFWVNPGRPLGERLRAVGLVRDPA